ncbi:MAG: branched-chain amino acid ABC transporter permease [Acidimicrobiales bacterium]
MVSILILGLVDAAVVGLAAVGLTLQFGVTNYLNFGYTEWITFSALVAYTFNASLGHVNIWLALAIAAVFSAGLAVIINRLVFARFARRSRDPFTVLIVTFMVGFLMNQTYLLIWGGNSLELKGGSASASIFSIGSQQVSLYQVISILVAIGCMLILEAFLHFTRVGRSMRAVSDNQGLAVACGLNTSLVTDIAWAISGLFGGIAGVVLAIQVHAFTIGLGNGYLYLIYPAVVIGGIGSPSGGLVAGLLVGVVAALGSLYVPAEVSIAVIFAVMVAIVMLRPSGLLGTGRHPSMLEA